MNTVKPATSARISLSDGGSSCTNCHPVSPRLTRCLHSLCNTHSPHRCILPLDKGSAAFFLMLLHHGSCLGVHREVKGNYADRSTYGGIDPESDGVLVCTIEKANQTITGLLEEENMGHLSCIVVDELHMVQPHKTVTNAPPVVKIGIPAPRARHILHWQPSSSPGLVRAHASCGQLASDCLPCLT